MDEKWNEQTRSPHLSHPAEHGAGFVSHRDLDAERAHILMPSSSDPKPIDSIRWALTGLMAAPLIPMNIFFAHLVFYPQPWLREVPGIFQVILVVLYITELVALILLSEKWADYLRKSKKIYLFRFSLQTCIVVMLMASILLFTNIHVTPVDGSSRWLAYGWPWPFYRYSENNQGWGPYWNFWNLTWNIIVGLALLGTIARLLERLAFGTHQIRRSHEMTAEVQGTIEPIHLLRGSDERSTREKHPPPCESTLQSLCPSLRERLLYGAPLFLMLPLALLSPVLIQPIVEMAARLKLDLSGPTILTFLWSDTVSKNMFMFCITWTGLTMFYFGWVSHERQRMRAFSMMLVILLILGLLAICLSLLLMLVRYPNCVARGTKIKSPKGPRKIEDLCEGDEVVTCSADGEEQTGIVQHISIDSAPGFLQIETTSGVLLRVTEEHPLATRTKWARAKTLSVGGELQLGDGFERVVSILYLAEPIEVFDITVFPNANFYADGVLVHNALKKK